MNTPDSILIVRRFFDALQRLKEDHRIRGKKTFTDRHAINRWNMNTCERQPERDMFQPAWLAYLSQDYGVSPSWILLGTGDFYLPGHEPPPPVKKKRGRKKKAPEAETHPVPDAGTPSPAPSNSSEGLQDPQAPK